MKNLANCKPSEFLFQTNKIRKAAEKWLTETDIMNIRKRLPEGMPEIKSDMSKDEQRKILDKRRDMMAEQAKANLSAILDAVMEQHPDETLEMLALCCFVDPAEVDDHPISEYLGAVLDMLEDETVVRFFTLLMQLGQRNTSLASVS